MVKLNNSFKGSTLIEVLVAMTLIVTVTSFFFLSAGNINKAFSIDLKISASIVIDSYLHDMDSTFSCDEIINHTSFKIRKVISPLGNNPELFIVCMTAYSNDGKMLIKKQRIRFYKPKL